MKSGYMYILKCADESYYTGSTVDLELRLIQHQNGEGANYTRKHLPVELVYFEYFDRIDLAFDREKQVQGWSRKKKEVLIQQGFGKLSPQEVTERLRELSKNYTEYPRDENGNLFPSVISAISAGSITEIPDAEVADAKVSNAKVSELAEDTEDTECHTEFPRDENGNLFPSVISAGSITEIANAKVSELAEDTEDTETSININLENDLAI